MGLPLALIDLAGLAALLLWGVRMVRTGLQRAFGPRLRLLMGKALGSRWRAFLGGILITALLQSSTATALMATGFVAKKVVGLVPALAVMLGANVGTTLIVQVLSFPVFAAAPAAVLAGYLLFGSRNTTAHDLGRVFIGLGLILSALHQMVHLADSYTDAPALRSFLEAASRQPLLEALCGAAFSWAAHSSAAAILLVASFAAKGVVSLPAALALTVGANLGAAINPVFESTTGTDPAFRRLPIGNLLNRLFGFVGGLLFLPQAAAWLAAWEPNPARAVADFHTFFNLALALLFFPWLSTYGRLLAAWFPDRKDKESLGQPLYLDPALLGTPAVALGNAAREALRLADLLKGMLERSRDIFLRGDRLQPASIKRIGKAVDKIHQATRSYLSAVDRDMMSEAERSKLEDILFFSASLEQAAGVADKELLALAVERIEKNLVLPPDAQAELSSILDRILANLQRAAALFVTPDLRVARMLAEEKDAFRGLEARASAAHFERMRANPADPDPAGALEVKVVRQLKRINGLIVASAAYPILERAGELLPSRLRRATADEEAAK
ncbi:Na/Pi cotransporter [Methylacidimicrobium sp. AP8]|uniref:Na/Pi cotransporter family protein n=1 Tax=Methylacidimicrobium sp. AP8 TaxID=2730359 RepID=UPI0018C1A697|nr:Na/Pi cotransporter family protein [Methylacidimicrobium sp. AP8]CAB4243840.1 Na/Pi cotransporter [Methylacidimicrobium sp. AP8]